jgi:hypothetical protein
MVSERTGGGLSAKVAFGVKYLIAHLVMELNEDN